MYNDVDDMLRASQQKKDNESKANKPAKGNSNQDGKMTKKQKTIIKLILTLFIFPIVLVCLFMLGMAVGYQYGGGAPGEVFDGNTWRNIIFIIFG